ncbi:hypothetical protein TFLX_05873 [Thermoflexales bacterium]|nr:hypothetical protein TFLX_05873 [Thermoflexales bacterium]
MSNRILRLLSISAAIFLAVISVAVTRSVLATPALRPAAQGNAYVEVCTWLDCKTGAVSYSQDDANNIVPYSVNTNTNSCQIDLENAGLRGTFYYNGGSSPDWLTTLSDAGHEVGSHLVNHDLNCAMPPACAPTCTLETLLQIPYTITDVNSFRQGQIDPNVAAIESRTGKPVVSMAYACGNADPGRMAAAQSYFAGVRSYYEPLPWGSNLTWIYDVNTPTPDEFMLLNADWYFHQALVDSAVNENGWDIITVHDYCEGINALKNISHTTWIAPVGEVLKYIRVRNATQITNYARSGTSISFDAVHNLPVFQRQQLDGTPLLPIVYDNPVTLRARVPMTANILSVQANGVGITYTVGVVSGTNYVWFNTPLTTSQHIEIEGDAPLAVRVVHLSATPSAADATPALLVASGASVCLLIMWTQRQRRRRGRQRG